MRRRSLLATAAGALAAPRIGRGAEASVLRFISQADLAIGPGLTAFIVIPSAE